MSTPEFDHPEDLVQKIAIGQYSLAELQQDPALFQSLLGAYCDVFNAPPWNQNWEREAAEYVVNVGLGTEHKATLATSNNEVLGFFWGHEGSTDEIVPKAVHTYLASEIDDWGRAIYPDKDRMLIVNTIKDRLREGNYPDSLFYGMEEGVLPRLRNTYRGAKIAYELLKSGVTTHLAKGSAKWMFGMTSQESPMYAIFNKAHRKADLIFEMSELQSSVPGIDHTNNPLVFLVKDMREFFRAY